MSSFLEKLRRSAAAQNQGAAGETEAPSEGAIFDQDLPPEGAAAFAA